MDNLKDLLEQASEQAVGDFLLYVDAVYAGIEADPQPSALDRARWMGFCLGVRAGARLALSLTGSAEAASQAQRS